MLPRVGRSCQEFRIPHFQIFIFFFAFPTVACVVLCTLCLNNLRATCNRCLRVMQFIAFCRQEPRVTPAQVPILVLFTTWHCFAALSQQKGCSDGCGGGHESEPSGLTAQRKAVAVGRTWMNYPETCVNTYLHRSRCPAAASSCADRWLRCRLPTRPGVEASRVGCVSRPRCCRDASSPAQRRPRSRPAPAKCEGEKGNYSRFSLFAGEFQGNLWDCRQLNRYQWHQKGLRSWTAWFGRHFLKEWAFFILFLYSLVRGRLLLENYYF